MKKKLVKEYKEVFEGSYDLDDIISELILKRDELKSSGVTNIKLDIDSGYCNISTFLIGDRLETDEEYKDRIKQEKFNKDIEKQKKLKLYNKLKRELKK